MRLCLIIVALATAGCATTPKEQSSFDQAMDDFVRREILGDTK